MSEPKVRFACKPDSPHKPYLITVENGNNATVLEPEEAIYVYHELGRILRRFGLLASSTNGHETDN